MVLHITSCPLMIIYVKLIYHGTGMYDIFLTYILIINNKWQLCLFSLVQSNLITTVTLGPRESGWWKEVAIMEVYDFLSIKLINNRWAWALVSQGWWSRAKLSKEGGNHGNPEAATTHQEAPSHWRTQWNTYQPHRWNQPTGGWDGRKMQLPSVTASETDSCKH